jgi:thiol-disulfide isomerase/thioredoxin
MGHSMNMTRRSVLAGLSALTAFPAVADETPALPEQSSPIARGILADNGLAKAFETAPPQLPDVTIVGLSGERKLSDLWGRTLIMPLWAEWCPPCLGELPDFARLQKLYGNDKFAIVPILTSPVKRVSPEIIAQLFQALHADIFEPLMESNFGGRLLRTMARKGSESRIPCNLLVAPNGTVVGREFGLLEKDEDGPKGKQLIKHAEDGDSLSLWGQRAGEELAAALANGFLA